MNLKKHAILSLTLLSFLFTSCATSNSSTSASTSSSDNSSSQVQVEETTSLQASALKTTYHRYDLINYSDFDVNIVHYVNGEITQVEDVQNFTIIDNTNAIIEDGYRISNTGNFEIAIHVDGYENVSLTLDVKSVYSLVQTLDLLNEAKNVFEVGSQFDDSLTFNLLTSYVSSEDEKTHQYSETVTDYTVKIDGTDASEFVFEKSMDYQVRVTVKGWQNQNIYYTYYVYAIYPEHNTLHVIEDDTITFDSDTSTQKIKISYADDDSTTSYYTPSQIDNSFDIASYGEKSLSNERNTPSTGKVPLLVIPIIIPGYDSWVSLENWNLIYKAFFGKSEDLHFESLHSYYYQASFGKLDFTGTVTDFFDPSTVSSDFALESDYMKSTTDFTALSNLAVNWAKETYDLNLQDYDANNDGAIDGLHLIYLRESTSGTNFWPSTSTTTNVGTEEEPVVNMYTISGLKDLQKTLTDGSAGANSDLDAHTIIHETGHLLGLSDYYSYSGQYVDGAPYDALGNFDMMDKNIGDHNSNSKMLLGWTKPYVVYGSSEIEIPVSTFENACIVIPYDNKTFTTTTKESGDIEVAFNMFDEYLVLEFYTDYGLNSQDYDYYNAKHIEGKGVRLYHVDSRLGYATNQGDDSYLFTLFDNPDDVLTHTENNLLKVINNSEAGSRAEQYYSLSSEANYWDEIRLISQDKRKLNGSTSGSANSESLFTTGDTFTLDDYSAQFNDGALNSKKTLSASIEIL